VEKIPDYLKLWKELVELRDSDRECKAKRTQDGLIKQTQNGLNKQTQDGLIKPTHDVWNNRAHEFEEGIRKRWAKSDSSRAWLMDQLRSHPDSTLLDIGAGTGAWSCLVASACRKVTAVEPSQSMIDVLKKNIDAQGLTNVDVIEDAWPLDPGEVFDFTLSSHSVYGCPDFRGFVEAMVNVTRRTCVFLLRAPVADGLMSRIARKIMGQPHDSVNFHVAYNALLQMGIFPNVLIEDTGLWSPWTNETLDEAIQDVKRKMGIPGTNRYDDFLNKILTENLEQVDGKVIWPRGIKSALVYWHVAT
jgi:SAM-dependent methyltransferase